MANTTTKKAAAAAVQLKYTPSPGRLLVALDDPEEVSKGGIYIPPSAQQPGRPGNAPTLRATVVAVGIPRINDNGVNEQSVYKVGQRIAFKYGNFALDDKHLIIGFADVLAICNEES